MFLVATLVLTVPLVRWLEAWAIIPLGILYAIALYFALKLEKFKKANDIQSYKEIVAFTEGKRLDEIQKQREIGKRPYQKGLAVIAGAVIAVIVCFLMEFLMK